MIKTYGANVNFSTLDSDGMNYVLVETSCYKILSIIFLVRSPVYCRKNNKNGSPSVNDNV